MDYTIAFKFFAALFAVMNPFTNLPVFMSLTPDQKDSKTKNQTTIAIIIIMFVALFAGNNLLRIFGVTTGAFEATGGIIIFLMALSMAQGKTSSIHNSGDDEKDGQQKNNPSIVPLAIPILSGPGTIATIIIYHNYLTGTAGLIAASTIILICTLLIWIVFSFANKIKALIGSTGLRVITRIMGIVLGSIAIEMIANGLKDLLPL
ncbi:MAG: MarC family protein [Rickettsiales bacterium]|nr:MarC family protein [Rickettsiales bacterium]